MAHKCQSTVNPGEKETGRVVESRVVVGLVKSAQLLAGAPAWHVGRVAESWPEPYK